MTGRRFATHLEWLLIILLPFCRVSMHSTGSALWLGGTRLGGITMWIPNVIVAFGLSSSLCAGNTLVRHDDIDKERQCWDVYTNLIFLAMLSFVTVYNDDGVLPLDVTVRHLLNSSASVYGHWNTTVCIPRAILCSLTIAMSPLVLMCAVYNSGTCYRLMVSEVSIVHPDIRSYAVGRIKCHSHFCVSSLQ